MTIAARTTTAFTAPDAASPAAPPAAPLPTPNPDVVFRAMPDGGVLFSAASETYFGLNPTGTFIWEHLAPVCGTIDELCSALLERYPDAPADAVRRDVVAVLDDLTSNGLASLA